jgi:hypothetical protein
MSIYVAMPTLVDNQTKFTITYLFATADNPSDITVGLPFMTPEFWYKDHLEFLEAYPNVKHSLFKDPVPNLEIGVGRANSLSFYSGEDYVLQVDSHTFFDKGWDTKLIKMHQEAVAETKNEKTILTAYLSHYTHPKNGERNRPNAGIAKYPFFWFQRWDEIPNMPMWTDTEIYSLPESIRPTKDYLPCVKVNAQFVFGNKHYAENTGLPLSTVFFEEELFQTANLLDSGFSLVFPNQAIPVSHLFANDVENNTAEYDADTPSWRARNVANTPEAMAIYTQRTQESYLAFINDPANKEKLEKFHRYTQCHPKYGPYNEWYIPKDYSR